MEITVINSTEPNRSKQQRCSELWDTHGNTVITIDLQKVILKWFRPATERVSP